MRNSSVELYDVTLRDGMQGEQMRISIPNAIKLVKRLGEIGINVVEVGMPGSNSFTDSLFAALKKEENLGVKLAAFCRTRKPNSKVEDSSDLMAVLDSGVQVVTVVAKSRFHDVITSLQTTGFENLQMLSDTIRFFKDNGLRVIVDLEHAFSAFWGRVAPGQKVSCHEEAESREYLLKMVDVCVENQVTCVLCDTVGGVSPDEVIKVLRYLRGRFIGFSGFGVHCHNDRGLATINTVNGLLHGSFHAQVTVNGYGERPGNASLAEVVANMYMEGRGVLRPDQMKKLSALARDTARWFNKELSGQSPIVGRSAFTTAAGIHASSMGRQNGAYLFTNPELFGNREGITINGNSGRSNIALLAESLGFKLTSGQIDQFILVNNDLIQSGCFDTGDDALFQLKSMEVLGGDLVSFAVTKCAISANMKATTANVSMKIGEVSDRAIGVGTGSFDACAKVVKAILVRHFPDLLDVHLEEYEIRAIDVGEKGTEAKVVAKLQIARGEECRTFAGVSDNSLTAAINALLSGYQWFALQM